MLKFYEACKNLLVLLLLLTATTAWAQEVQVTGKITTSDDGSPLPGVNIVEKSSSNGTVSDSQGNYSLSVKSGSTLVFSFIGYTSQEVVVGTQTTVDISLTTDITALSEVVVVGYGTQERKDVTGSVVAISTKDFNRGIMSSPQDLLVGKVAGVSVVSSGGAPGAGSTIRIRGGSSLSASNDPLIVIDGFPVDNTTISGSPNPLSTINPNDIESITVLKDASAAAIYGSRASNGVIIITTKKGKTDKFQLGYNGTFSTSTPIKYVDVLSGDELRTLATDLQAEGFSGLDATAISRLGDANTDWQKEIFRTAISADHNITASGSFKNIPYRISYGYTSQEGILKTTDLKRNTIAVTLNPVLLNDNLSVNANIKSSFSKHNFSDAGAVGTAVSFDPTQTIRNGNYKYGGYTTWTSSADAFPDGTLDPNGAVNSIAISNPVALIEQTNNVSDVNRTIGNLQLDYRLPFFPELRVNVNGGFDISKGEGIDNAPVNAGFTKGLGRLKDYNSENTSTLLEIYGNYRKDFGDHTVDVTGGYSWQHFERENLNYSRIYDESVLLDSTFNASENFLVSFFGRLNYSFKDKYLLTLSLRDDGSSRFGEDTRWGLFPAAALAWNLSQESFLQDLRAISNLKIRVGYGVTGQQDIPLNYYPYLATYRESTNGASYQFGNEFYSTYRPDPYDVNIKWEETTTYNVGIDFGVLNDRLTGSVDAYQRTTDDLISTIPISAGSNFSNFLTTNVGSLENRGIELSLTGAVVQSTNVNWNVGVNFSHNKNEITKLLKADDPDYAGINVGGIAGGVGNTIQNHQVGFPAGSFFVFQQVYDDNGNPIEGLYVDRTGEGGQVTANLKNKYRYKSPAPDFLMGINSSVRYKDFDFYFSGRLSVGNYVYNNVHSTNGLYQTLYNQSGYFTNLSNSVLDSNFDKAQYFSDYYIENASFFKMDNISAGYNFKNVFDGKGTARISFTVQNAFTITDYSGLDPEVDLTTGNNYGGIDNNFYPRPRVFLLGINLTY